MLFVYLYNQRLAKKINSQAIDSVAKDNLSDALVSLGATLGIIGAQYGMPWLDPIFALIVGVIICHTAFGIFRSTSLSLTDGISKKEIEKLNSTINKVEEVINVKNVKARYYGSNLIVDLVIELDKSLSFEEAHHISTLVEERVKKEHQAIDVHVHIEPLP